MRRPLTERYCERLAGVLSCYDRIIVTGTLPGACYADGMTAFLSARQVRIFDYPRFAEPLRDRVRERAAELAAGAGISIEHIANSHIRKEDVVAKVLATRGDHPGLVHVISAMEACPTYKPWHSKETHRTFLRPATGKCLHYYFYFIDADLGLIYLRVPKRSSTRAPRLPSREKANPIKPAKSMLVSSGVPGVRHAACPFWFLARGSKWVFPYGAGLRSGSGRSPLLIVCVDIPSKHHDR